jgi:hypothetical protein
VATGTAVQGYFTSRPSLKGYIRVLSSYLQSARQLEVLAAVGATGLTRSQDNSSEPKSTLKLEEAMAIAQHHDAASVRKPSYHPRPRRLTWSAKLVERCQRRCGRDQGAEEVAWGRERIVTSVVKSGCPTSNPFQPTSVHLHLTTRGLLRYAVERARERQSST